ncbi:MAG: histidine kinase [Opitutales bacterium]|jgi:signal transduction histidine kinase|nr:histidine kinase [Opitutales bacterium]
MLSLINQHLKRLPQPLLLCLGFLATVCANAAASVDALEQQSLEQLEMRLAAIDAERSKLAKLTFRQGVGNLGWLSKQEKSSQQQQWVEIQLHKETRIDTIALAPVLWHDADQGILPDGFPSKFQIRAGTLGDTVGHVVASFDSQEQATSRIAPFVFPIEPIQASWVRVEVSEATKSVSNGLYGIEIGELLVFNGQQIVSIDAEVKASSYRSSLLRRAHVKRSIVDGFTPYLMDVQGENSQSYVAFYETEQDQLDFTIDLGQPHPINRLQLHAADINENVPKIQHADYAFPKQFVVQGAQRADFSDAVDLCSYKRNNIYEAGPITIKQFPEATCRYIRLRVVEGYKAPEANIRFSCVGFAEIEIFSNDENVALNGLFKVSSNIIRRNNKTLALTDGENHFGSIIPYRVWIQQLAYRADLESERPVIAAELSLRYAKQKKNIRILSWTTGLLAIGIIFAFLIERNLGMRREARLKERFAADLHDEIGADLHTIGLLSDLAEDARTNPEKLSKLLQHIRSNTEESGHSVRNISQLLNGNSKEGLEAMMRRTAERTVTHLEHEIFIEGSQYLDGLKSSTHSDLLRFYKECLVNVCRHSDATRLRTRLSASRQKIDLTVSDNGQGISESAKNWVPKSLKRRAKLLGAKVQLEESGLGGTKIHLTLRHSFFSTIVK